ELRFELPTHERMNPVRPDQQIRRAQFGKPIDAPAEFDLDAGVMAEVLEEAVELETGDRREAVAVDVDRLAPVDDSLDRPILHPRQELRVQVGSVALEKRQRALREHHAEAERRIGGVLLVDMNLP